MSKLTVTLPDDLHAQIRQELEEQGITTGQFIEIVVTKYFTKDKKGENNMATRTIAFQVSEELYQRIKDYLMLGAKLLAQFLRPVYGQTVVRAVPWVKAEGREVPLLSGTATYPAGGGLT